MIQRAESIDDEAPRVDFVDGLPAVGRLADDLWPTRGMDYADVVHRMSGTGRRDDWPRMVCKGVELLAHVELLPWRSGFVAVAQGVYVPFRANGLPLVLRLGEVESRAASVLALDRVR